MTATLPSMAATARRRVTDRDEDFRKVYETYYSKIFAYMYSRVGDVELAKDLVASTMEKAYAKGHEVRNPAAYGAWLFMIAKNVMFSHFRSTKLENTRYELAQNELRFVDRPSNPETSLLFRERLDELKRQRSKLSTRDQDLLSLQFDAELSGTEIGMIMNMSRLNVRVSIFRALRRLKTGMERAMD
jgi:RNA polymerase sigma factor (sigma-70 family)